jgi:hypothetical protein
VLPIALALLFFPTSQQSPSALEQDPGGWIDLIETAGPDLEGWTRVPIPRDGDLNPESQWTVDPKAGVLVCSGDKGHEWLRWDAPQRDGIFHVEWRFVPVSDGPTRYNSGIYVRNSEDGVIWHQAQTGDASGGFLFGDTLVDGTLERISTRDQVEDSRVKPAGEWNTYELVFTGNRVSLWVNGDVTVEWDGCQVPSGHVGLEAEGYRIEFRRVLLKPL